MHNTSPMTGAVLAHRYLTENFALRHLIETYEAQLSEKRTTEGRRAGVSKTCISPPLSELSDEADSYMEEEWSNEAPSRRMVRMEEDMPILSHQVDDG
ncbi:PUB12 [Symbiodinium sp. KB8]|nr:PUB12 [Symbiodinium sp. KB8]